MQEQNASPINLMLLLALSYLLHKSNITQLGIFSIQLLIIETGKLEYLNYRAMKG